MSAPRFFLLALLFLTLITPTPRVLGDDDSATQPSIDTHTFVVVEVIGVDGKLDLRPMDMDEVHQAAAALETEYTKALRAWSLEEDAFYKDSANTDRVFDIPKPTHPTIKQLRTHLTQDQATQLAQKLREEAIERKKKTFYRSMLGVYQGKKGPVAFVSLSVPDGRNIAGRDVLAHLEGKAELPLRGFTATGKVHIPYTGEYVVDSFGTVMLDNKSVGGRGRQNKVHLEHGTYTVKISTTGGDLHATRVSIRPDGSNTPLPIYNSEADIDNFLSTRINDTMPTELSGWIKVDNGPVAP